MLNQVRSLESIKKRYMYTAGMLIEIGTLDLNLFKKRFFNVALKIIKEGGRRKAKEGRGCMYTCSWFTLFYSRN